MADTDIQTKTYRLFNWAEKVFAFLVIIWRKILSLIPGTYRFNRAVRRAIVFDIGKHRRFIRSFVPFLASLELQTPGDDIVRGLQRKLEKCEQRISVYRAIYNRVEKTLITLMYTGACVIMLSSLAVNRFALLMGYQGESNGLLLMVVIFIVLAILQLVNQVNRLAAALKLRGLPNTLATVVWPFVVSFGSAFLAYRYILALDEHTSDLYYFTIIFGYIIAALFLGWVFAMQIPISLTKVGFDYLNQSHYPEETFIHTQIMIISKIISTSQWEKLDHRRSILPLLETAAVSIEKYLPRLLESTDPNTDVWLIARTGEIAAGLRSLKKWVLMPRSDTPHYLMKRIWENLRNAASGEWDDLHREPIAAISTPQRLVAFVNTTLRAGRSFLGAGGPLLFIWGLQRTTFALPPETANSLILVGFAWLVVTFLIWVDPALKEKLDILGSLRNLGKTTEH